MLLEGSRSLQQAPVTVKKRHDPVVGSPWGMFVVTQWGDSKGMATDHLQKPGRFPGRRWLGMRNEPGRGAAGEGGEWESVAKLWTTWPVQRAQRLLSPGQLLPHRDVGLVLPILLFQEKPEIRILFMLATNWKF